MDVATAAVEASSNRTGGTQKECAWVEEVVRFSLALWPWLSQSLALPAQP